MPYIERKQRQELSEGRTPETSGELNYMITLQIIEYLKLKKFKYDTLNDVIGALEGAKSEFYRRIVVPYEKGKKEENGDVYL